MVSSGGVSRWTGRASIRARSDHDAPGRGTGCRTPVAPGVSLRRPRPCRSANGPRFSRGWPIPRRDVGAWPCGRVSARGASTLCPTTGKCSCIKERGYDPSPRLPLRAARQAHDCLLFSAIGQKFSTPEYFQPRKPVLSVIQVMERTMLNEEFVATAIREIVRRDAETTEIEFYSEFTTRARAIAAIRDDLGAQTERASLFYLV